MAVNLVDSTDITVSQNNQNIQLNTTVDLNAMSTQVSTNTTDISNLQTYSSLETSTGQKWTDGKPIYRKVIYVPSLPNATSTDYQHNISNVSKIWCDMGNSYIVWSNGDSSPFNYIGGTSFNAMIEIRAFSTTKFTIDAHSTNRSALSAYVTINYTKTTD